MQFGGQIDEMKEREGKLKFLRIMNEEEVSSINRVV